MNNNEEWFIIDNLEEFTQKARTIVYGNFGKWNQTLDDGDIIDQVKLEEQEDLDSLLSQQEALNIVKSRAKKQHNKKTKLVRYTIDSHLFIDIIQDLNSRMISNILTNLVNKGLVETSYDSELNDFVFWVKNSDDDTKKEK